MYAYLNSTPGTLAVLWSSRFKKIVFFVVSGRGENNSPPLPDFTEQQAATLAETFDGLADAPFQRFRDMKKDQVRKDLDAAVAETMGWDEEEIANIRYALAAEPSVTGQRAQ